MTDYGKKVIVPVKNPFLVDAVDKDFGGARGGGKTNISDWKLKDRIKKLIKLQHVPSGHGKGKWQSKRGLIRYKLDRHKKNKIARASRKRNG